MIVGNGLIGGSLKRIDDDGVIFFASGVSNSKCEDPEQFNREINLISKYINTSSKFIYFSSIHQYITNPLYLEHKKKMEDIISSKINNYIIVRLPQIIGDDGNQSNLINFLYQKIKNKEEFNIYQTKRSLLDIEDLVNIVKFLINSKYVGFFDVNYIEIISVDKIIEIIEDITKNKSVVKSKINMDINISENTEYVSTVLKMYTEEKDYNKKIITKYLNKKI
jgi:UDP-2-acetamido-2,6-beta-L-arabino-hexul-4-ose reductase